MPVAHNILRKLHNRYCVYSYPAATAPALLPPAIDGLAWMTLDDADVARLYSGEPRRAAAFKRFLKQGAVGVGLTIGGEWAAHAWMATPGNARPPHIPARQSPQVFWIFFCATQRRYGGKGLYKFAQRLLIGEAFRQVPEPEILIDTTPDNILSRRAIVSTGFSESGMLDCLFLWVPRVVHLPLYSRWERGMPHPPLPGGRV